MICVKSEIDSLRELAKNIAEIAALPVQNEKKRLWLEHNMRRSTRPLVVLGEVPWNEMNVNEDILKRYVKQYNFWRILLK